MNRQLMNQAFLLRPYRSVRVSSDWSAAERCDLPSFWRQRVFRFQPNFGEALPSGNRIKRHPLQGRSGNGRRVAQLASHGNAHGRRTSAAGSPNAGRTLASPLRASLAHCSRPACVRAVPHIDPVTHETGEVIVPAGAAAANRLGLTTQVPGRSVYLTSGRSRQLALGAQVIELRHAPRWQLVLPGRPAGEVVRALAWLGRQRGAKVAPHLARTVPADIVQELSAVRRLLPTWVAQDVSNLVVVSANRETWRGGGVRDWAVTDVESWPN